MEMNMRLIGARNLSEITPDLVDASALRNRAGLAPTDHLYSQTCEHSCFISSRNESNKRDQTNPSTSPSSATRSSKPSHLPYTSQNLPAFESSGFIHGIEFNMYLFSRHEIEHFLHDNICLLITEEPVIVCAMKVLFDTISYTPTGPLERFNAVRRSVDIPNCAI